MISTRTYPNILKVHKVSFLRKITLFCLIYTDLLLFYQMSLYLYNNLLNDFQYGFRKGCGTEEAIAKVVNYI